MPYTPPSLPPTRVVRYSGESRVSAANVQPTLPQSASYLTKYQRSPSSVMSISRSGNVGAYQLATLGMSEDLRSLIPSGSVQQSPLPVTNSRGMPSGTILSPLESPPGSDDETLRMRGRKLANLKDLQTAMSYISTWRESSPTEPGEHTIPPNTVGAVGMRKIFGAEAPNALKPRSSSQTRSTMVPKAILPRGFSTGCEGGDKENPRKKSGEPVRPALRPSHRPSSMPGTPTFPRTVHFDPNLEHVRHFLQRDRPLAISAGSSPLGDFECDSEYPFPRSEDKQAVQKMLVYEWELITSNFPTDSAIRNSLPARVEKIWMSSNNKSMHGSVAVANLAYRKFVACRFTFDYWKTATEVAAEYISEVHPRSLAQSSDRFMFTIKLSGLAHLEKKTLFFCVRYSVLSQEYWDNNNNANFQVGFRKRYLPQNGKKNFQGTGAKPAGEHLRSTHRASPTTNSSSKSSSAQFFSMHFMQPNQAGFLLDKYMDVSSHQRNTLGMKKTAAGGAGGDLVNKVSTPCRQSFMNRYNLRTSFKGALGGKNNRKPALGMKGYNTASTLPGSNEAAAQRPGIAASLNSSTESFTMSDYSYNEILDNFCFSCSMQANESGASHRAVDWTTRAGAMI